MRPRKDTAQNRGSHVMSCRVMLHRVVVLVVLCHAMSCRSRGEKEEPATPPSSPPSSLLSPSSPPSRGLLPGLAPTLKPLRFILTAPPEPSPSPPRPPACPSGDGSSSFRATFGPFVRSAPLRCHYVSLLAEESGDMAAGGFFLTTSMTQDIETYTLQSDHIPGG